MSNWLGIKTPYVPVGEKHITLACGHLEQRVNSAPQDSQELHNAIKSQRDCIDKVFEQQMLNDSKHQAQIDNAVLAGTFLIPLLVLAIFFRRIIRLVDGGIVNSAAYLIRGKRKASAYTSSVKARIEEKAKD